MVRYGCTYMYRNWGEQKVRLRPQPVGGFNGAQTVGTFEGSSECFEVTAGFL